MNTNKQAFQNPLLANGADPWIIRHSDGCYYMSVTLRDRIALWKSDALSTIAEQPPTVIWRPSAADTYCKQLWAPELHYIDDCWYIYYTAASEEGNDQSRRICVLQLQGNDPLQDNWSYKGAINTEHPGLDGTVLSHRDELYFFYSGYGYFPDYGSAIYAARMENPWTLVGDNVLITAPTEEWEKQGGMAINEGPCFLQRHGKIFLIFSASATWSDDYCLGMTSISEEDNLLDASAWNKHNGPVFAKAPEQGVYAPGHNSFTSSADGHEDWIVYHAYSYSETEMQRTDRSPRSLRIQPFAWTEQGIPLFGAPLSTDTWLDLPSGESIDRE